jgi:hypothetical protein
MNCARVVFVITKESMLENKNSKKSQQIAVYFIIFRKFVKINDKNFNKFKKKFWNTKYKTIIYSKKRAEMFRCVE